MNKPLETKYDSFSDVLEIEGIRYAGALFRCFGLAPTHADGLLKIVKREDGVVTVQEVRDKELAHRFDLVAKAGITHDG